MLKKNNFFVLYLVSVLSVLLVTPTAKADLDIDWICITSVKDYIDSIPENPPWKFDIWAYVIDKGTLNHIDITKPGASIPFATVYEYKDPGWWQYFSPTDYLSLNDVRVDYPEGVYTFEFCESDGTVIRTVSLDHTGLPSEPTNPVDFTYPATDGATGIPTNPTFTWNVNSNDVDALLIAFEDATADTIIYWDAPVSTTTTSWTPSALLASREYLFMVSVFNVKNWGGGSEFPTMTVDGDVFEYSLMIEYLNEINFTTGLSPAIDATIDILADTITLKTKWVTCHIWPPAGYDVADIKPDSILLEGGILAVRTSIRKKKQILVAKFPASDLNLQTGPRELFVRGELTDGTPFVGSDFVTVVTKGGKKN